MKNVEDNNRHLINKLVSECLNSLLLEDQSISPTTPSPAGRTYNFRKDLDDLNNAYNQILGNAEFFGHLSAKENRSREEAKRVLSSKIESMLFLSEEAKKELIYAMLRGYEKGLQRRP